MNSCPSIYQSWSTWILQYILLQFCLIATFLFRVGTAMITSPGCSAARPLMFGLRLERRAPCSTPPAVPKIWKWSLRRHRAKKTSGIPKYLDGSPDNAKPNAMVGWRPKKINWPFLGDVLWWVWKCGISCQLSEQDSGRRYQFQGSIPPPNPWRNYDCATVVHLSPSMNVSGFVETCVAKNLLADDHHFSHESRKFIWT